MTALLDVKEISKTFEVGGRVIEACKSVSLKVLPGEIVGVVGESGSGKSTLGSIVLGLLKPNSGEVVFDGRPLSEWTHRPLDRTFRASVQAVFQDPLLALDSKRSIGWLVQEPLVVHRVVDRASRRARVNELLESVGLEPSIATRLPRELSGGQLQRVNIARAMAVSPRLLVCDEPLSALDVSVQAVILNLFLGIQNAQGTAMLFISHAIPVARHLSDSLVVMYAGRVVERGDTEAVCSQPLHPYTKLLLESSPDPDPRAAYEIPPTKVREDLPSVGCRFAPRCPLVIDKCRTAEPALRIVAGERLSACWRASEMTGTMTASSESDAVSSHVVRDPTLT